MELKNKFILDACCSVKAMWYDKNHPNAVYIDIREEPNGFMGYGRKEGIHPDCIMDFRKMDFSDKAFKLVIFEPPHLSKLGKTSLFRKKFGCLNAETWQSDLQKGFAECWRVLDDYGTLIFKWSDSEIPFQKVLDLIKERPLFYNTTNYKSTSVTKWFCFMKIHQSNGGTNFTKSSADDFPTESLISVKRESDDSPNSPHDSLKAKEEANFS